MQANLIALALPAAWTAMSDDFQNGIPVGVVTAMSVAALIALVWRLPYHLATAENRRGSGERSRNPTRLPVRRLDTLIAQTLTNFPCCSLAAWLPPCAFRMYNKPSLARQPPKGCESTGCGPCLDSEASLPARKTSLSSLVSSTSVK